MFSLYTILGLEENASAAVVEKSYSNLCASLKNENFEPGSLGDSQCQDCLRAIEHAYQTLSDPASRSQYEQLWKSEYVTESRGEIQPKLGQLCVASGMISLEDLQLAIDSQSSIDLSLGQVLLESKLISQSELDGLLLGQKLIQLPPDTPHSIGQRLMAMGLVIEDMVRIALIEQRTFGKPLGDLLVAHEWVDKRILEILMEPSN